jgi:predicted PhzF superfamily epimerase YddE/YHI9
MVAVIKWRCHQTDVLLHSFLGNTNDEIYFETLSGELIVQKSKTQDGAVSMNFPQFTEMYDIELSNQQSFGTKFPAVRNRKIFAKYYFS